MYIVIFERQSCETSCQRTHISDVMFDDGHYNGCQTSQDDRTIQLDRLYDELAEDALEVNLTTQEIEYED